MAKRRPAERHLDEALRAAALATANERLGHPPDEETMVRLADEIAAAKRADPALTVQRIATTLGVPEDTIEELIAWADGEPE
jgi:hypothetical protein